VSLNSIIISTLAPTNVPVAFRVYRGSETEYIRFFEIVDVPTAYAENELQNTQKSIQIDVFSKGNYAPLIEQVKTLMKEAGFLWKASQEFYEEDTGYFHYALTFNYNVQIQN
jgi:hypothetical protein